MTKQYFGTDGIRGRVGQHPITPEFVIKLGWAAGRALSRQGRSKILIGKDTRISGYLFESALEAGLSSAGVDVILLGPMPTPGIAYLTRTLRAQAGIVISASHNPYHDNGIKFFSASGTKLPDDMEAAIEGLIDTPMQMVDSAKLGRAERLHDAPGRYIEFCKSTFPSAFTLNTLKIVLDCANGATYHIAPHVFAELGAEIITLHNHPNGLNINDRCGSTAPNRLQQAVIEHKADLGIAFDGDGDRVVCVDCRGQLLDGDALLYVISMDRLACQQDLSGGVVGTVMTNMGLQYALSLQGIPLHRTAVGDRYVLEKLHSEQLILGGENSGHLICLDRTTTGDGIVAGLQVVAAMCRTQKPLHELAEGLHVFPQVMINVPIAQPIQQAQLNSFPSVAGALQAAQAGLGQSGRVLLRPSGTEPLIRVMVESEHLEQAKQWADIVADAVRGALST